MRQVKKAAISLAVTLCQLAMAGATHAETPPQAATGAAQTDQEALSKQLWDWYGEATAYHDEGKLSEAWALYQRVWKYRKTYDVATSLGGVCFERREYALAAHYYRIALDGMVPTQSPKFVEKVQQAFDKSRAEVAELKVTVMPVEGKSVKGLTITDVSANVVLEEPIYLEPGERQLEAAAPGHETVTFQVLAKPGATVEWEIRFGSDAETQDPQSTTYEPSPEPERLTTVRHPWIVFPIGGLLTAGLAYGAWYNVERGRETHELAAELGLTAFDCEDATANAACQRAANLRRQGREADTRAWWLGGGAVLAAATTGIVYWLWETEVPVSVSFDPTQNYGEMRLNYDF